MSNFLDKVLNNSLTPEDLLQAMERTYITDKLKSGIDIQEFLLSNLAKELVRDTHDRELYLDTVIKLNTTIGEQALALPPVEPENRIAALARTSEHPALWVTKQMLVTTEARKDVIDHRIYATKEAIDTITKSMEQMRQVLKAIEETPPK
ncbi:MAG: hypothetical protein [Bacteriophage sp.]|nr:MAG: hypothetical protein [Bacteriophage sp.]